MVRFVWFVLLFISDSVVSTTTTQNLLLNGDAEAHRCTSDWTAQTPVPGFRVLRGAASVLCYSAFKTAGEIPVLPTIGKSNIALFAAPGIDTAIEQVVDLSSAAKAIDRGAVSFRLSAWLGGWRDSPEQARLLLIFRDHEDRALGQPVQLAGVGVDARLGKTGLFPRETNGTVPRGTLSAQVVLSFDSGLTSYHNAYADELSFALQGDVKTMGTPIPLAPPFAEVPSFDHVVVVMMENTNYADVINGLPGSPRVDIRMPFLASLAKRGVLLDNYWATYHPSDQNYVAMVSGDTWKFGSVYFPDYNLKVDHLGDQLEAKGLRWAAYVQNMAKPCNLATGDVWYAPDDEPFANFASVIHNRTRCNATMRDLKDFHKAITAGSLPHFSWVAADGYWDGEGAWQNKTDMSFSLEQQDFFLKSTLFPLLATPTWHSSRSLLVVTWDESLGWGWPDNRVPAILVASGGMLRGNSVDSTHYDHYSVLRTLQRAFGLPSLGRFDKFANPISRPFTYAASHRVSHLMKAKHNPLGKPMKDEDTRLVPTASVGTRGKLFDVFGQAQVPAAVTLGDPLSFVAFGKGVKNSWVRLSPLGKAPSVAVAKVRGVGGRFNLATGSIEPGRYALWLTDGNGRPLAVPHPVSLLSKLPLDPDHPGLAIVGAPFGRKKVLYIREASNFVLRYCRPKAIPLTELWIGVLPSNTTDKDWTLSNADTVGYHLRVGTTAMIPCAEQPAYVSELIPGMPYTIRMLHRQKSGNSLKIGTDVQIQLVPALPL